MDLIFVISLTIQPTTTTFVITMASVTFITNREQDPDDWGIVKAQGSSDDDPPLDPKECNVNIPTLNDAIPLIALCLKSLFFY